MNNKSLNNWEKELQKAIVITTPPNDLIKFLNNLPEKFIPVIFTLCHKESLPIIDIVPVGSSQRMTFIPDKIDLDLFVRFNTRDKEILVNFANLIVPKIAEGFHSRYEIRYAENPYGTIFYEAKEYNRIISIDIVATIWIPTPKELCEVLNLSGMARTPFHMFFLRDKIRGLEQEVRLFKYWLKKKFLYGQCGFTGFLSELLILRYKLFHTLLKHAAEISTLVLDIPELNRSKQSLYNLFSNDFQIIIIDPIDPTRNAAAGIQGFMGHLHLQRFVTLAKDNLEYPEHLWETYSLSSPYFTINIEFSSELKNRTEDEFFNRKIAIINALARQCEQSHIEILDALITENEILIKPSRIESVKYTRRGPLVRFKQHTEKFREKNPTAYIKDGRWYVDDQYLAFIDILNRFFERKNEFKVFITKVLVNDH